MPERSPAKPAAFLSDVIAALHALHGQQPAPPATDPFELVLLENVAYLGTPEHRRAAFDALRRTVGTTPAAILDAPRAALEKVAAHGILAARFAGKLGDCAQIAVERCGGDLGAALSGPIARARRTLRQFPGIGEPTADKILLFSHRLACLAPESNGLRTLVRLGFVVEDASYARMYRASQRLDGQLPDSVEAMQQAHLLLQHHGRTLCTNASPRCSQCPLAPSCAHARRLSRTPSAS